MAGARCAGERPAGLLRRVGRQPLGGAALRPGRGRLGQLSALPGELSAAACAGQRVQRLLPALLRPSPAGHRQAGWPVRGHHGDAPAVARPGPARAHGGLPPHVRGADPTARPVARAGADHDLRPPRRRAGECRRESPASRRGGHPRLAAALVQPESDPARRHCRRPGTLLRADPLPGRAGGGRDRTRQRHRLRAAPVLRPAALGRGERHLGLRRHAAPGHRDGPPAHAARHGPRHRRDAQGRRRGQRAVRPDARGHGDVPDGRRDAAGRARSAPEPPEQEVGRRDARLGADAPRRARSARADRQRAQAVPRRAGLLPARARPRAARRPRPATGQRHAQRRPAAGARGRRSGATQQLPALAPVRVRPGRSTSASGTRN